MIGPWGGPPGRRRGQRGGGPGAAVPGGSGGSPARTARRLVLIPRLLWAAVRCAPFSSAVLMAGAVLGGIVAALELVVTQQLVDALAGALAAGAAGQARGGGAAGAVSGGLAAFRSVAPWLGWLAAAMGAAAALEVASHLAEIDVQERVGMHLQREVILKAHRVELAYFEHPSFYDALERANQDMGGRIVQLLRWLVGAVGSVAGMAAILAVLWQAHWSLAPIMVAGVVPGFWVMLAMRKKTWWVYRIRTPESRLAMYFANLLTRRDEAKEVRLFTLSGHLLDRWSGLSTKLAEERRQLETRQARLGALTGMVATAAYSGCLLIVAGMIAGAQVSVGTFSMLMQALQQFRFRIGQVMQSLSAVHEQSLYLSDLYEFLEIDAPEAQEKLVLPGGGRVRKAPVPSEPQGVPEAGASAGSLLSEAAPLYTAPALGIELIGVSFTYPGSQQPVLHDVNLVIQPGERIALIGENGAGKSTLIRLILGLYRPQEGRILLGGRDIQDIPREELFRCFAAVFQEYARYQFTVADNIRFGRQWDADDAAIQRAAVQSGADAFIQRLPDGYRTLLGKPLGGVDLSGGEWQKLAIARALVRQAPVVILDEPTAALDPKAEAEVYRQFGEMTRGRTAILISHRLGSARLADRIVVLKAGRIVEIGTHEELLARGGEYAGFFSLQAQWYQ